MIPTTSMLKIQELPAPGPPQRLCCWIARPRLGHPCRCTIPPPPPQKNPLGPARPYPLQLPYPVHFPKGPRPNLVCFKTGLFGWIVCGLEIEE